MSPEQARGESHRVDVRTDIYSTGVVLYELLTGERPFRGNRRMLILQVMDDEPRPPRQLNDKIPRDLETICLKAMAKSPGRRYSSAQELAEDLRRFLNGEPIRARPIGWPERTKRWFLRNPVAASLLIAVSLGSAVGLWHLSTLSSQLVQSTAIEGAAQQAEMLEVVNAFYTSEVVDRVQPHGIVVTDDYATKKGAIPLPVVFLIESGQRIGEKSKSGMFVRLYSDHPFRSRKDGGAHDQFERDALAGLRQHPDDPVFRFEVYKDRPSLRYAAARRMDANCINCHNNDTNSPKRDWKVGEVGGVLEIIRPLDRDVSRTREGLRGTLILMAVVSGTLLGLSGLVLVTRSRRLK
jgi:eukaryotic-like serine/threonine-protein kinase